MATGLEPRLLTQVREDGGFRTLAEHRAVYSAPPPVRIGGDPRLIEEADVAGITGRGGANFPAHLKLRLVARGRSRPMAVVNGAEGEPAAGNEAMLMTRVPHLVIDGALFAAAALGAERLYICVGDHSASAVAGLERALQERRVSVPWLLRSGSLCGTTRS